MVRRPLKHVKDLVPKNDTAGEKIKPIQSGSLASERDKLANVAEIILLMEETRKGRDWLIDKIKQKKQRVKIKPTMGSVAILKACPADFIIHLLESLKKEDIDDFDTPPPLTETYHWFFTDIVAGSDPSLSTNEQARKIIVLNKVIEMTDIFRERDPESMIVLPTGDGMAIGFSDSAEKPLRLALEVHEALNRYNKARLEKDKVLIRIGLDTGPVYIIKDLNGNENVWGPGIIMARRVMDLAGDMNILASARFANDVKMLRSDYKNVLRPIGDYQIKHGEKLLIYNIYGDGFGNKRAPRESQKQKSEAAEEFQRTSRRFLFNRIHLDLKVTDPKTMMVHHSLLWNIVNISTEPAERIFYYLDGDVPKSFPDLNLSVSDEQGRELEIMSMNVNKPLHKEFFVKLRKPLKPNEKARTTILEYDWEEPERQHFYRFASGCKTFNYRLVVPAKMEINQKVAEVDSETGDKRYSPIPAVVKYLPDKTEITWKKNNIQAFEAFRFDW